MMKNIVFCLVILFCTLLTSCAKIERLHITINDQLSSTVQLVMVELREDYDRSVNSGTTADLETLKKQASDCNFISENYFLRNGYYGFKATKKFDSNSDLELGFACMNLGKFVIFDPIKYAKNIHESEYEFQIKISPFFLDKKESGQVVLTLPGDLQDSEIRLMGSELRNLNLNITKKQNGKDTIIWDISRLNDKATGSNSDSFLLFKASSKKSNFDLPSLISIFTLICGGGGIFSLIGLLKVKKKSKTT